MTYRDCDEVETLSRAHFAKEIENLKRRRDEMHFTHERSHAYTANILAGVFVWHLPGGMGQSAELNSEHQFLDFCSCRKC